MSQSLTDLPNNSRGGETGGKRKRDFWEDLSFPFTLCSHFRPPFCVSPNIFLRYHYSYRHVWIFLLVFFMLPLFAACRADSSNDSQARSHISCLLCHPGRALEENPVNDSFHNGLAPVDMSYYGEALEILRASSCRDCHRKEYDTWKRSKHGRSWEDPVFRAGLLVEPEGWCVNCHAPLSLQTADLDERGQINFHSRKSQENSEFRSEGINCAVCHVREGKIYTGKEPGMDARKRSLHEIYVDPSLRRGDFCKSCHEFPFPKSLGHSIEYSADPMQSTFREFHEHYETTKKSCQKCHYGDMKKGNHSLLGIRDLLQDKEMFSVKFRKTIHSETGSPLIQAMIHLKRAGHCLPDGDLFRMVEFSAYDGANQRIGGTVLARVVHPTTHVLEQDTRLCPGPGEKGLQRTVAFSVTGEASLCVVNYHLQGTVGELIQRRLHNYGKVNPGALDFIFGWEFSHKGDALGGRSVEWSGVIDDAYRNNFIVSLYRGPCE